MAIRIYTKSGVVIYGETKPVYFEEMKEREWILGDDTVDELYEYNIIVQPSPENRV